MIGFFAEYNSQLFPTLIYGSVYTPSSQIPFFVTACDYVLIGEEFYAASAYLSGSPEMIGSIKGQDYVKLLCMLFIGLIVAFSIYNLIPSFQFPFTSFMIDLPSINIENIFRMNIK